MTAVAPSAGALAVPAGIANATDMSAEGPQHRRPPSRHYDAEPLCGHPLWGEVGGLPCTRPADHAPGHVYHDPSGSAVDDRHRDGGHG